MISLLSKIFIKNENDPNKYREKTGILCSSFGVFLNILLFIGKYIAGVISCSISITADAFNNLSDAGSSIITLLGFKLAGKKADSKHPFGHGRIEYLSGLGISIAIIVVAVELIISSVQKIISPEAVDTSLVAIIILIVSILIKVYMYLYNKRIGEKINSSGMKATALDSLTDSIATLVVLIASLITKFTGINIDGYCGVLVALFILYTGIKSAIETISPLLGCPPEKEFVEELKAIVNKYPEAKGIHDLIVHDYGPGRKMISLHVEVDGRENIYHLHDVIDTIENELKEKLDCEAVIHMDPIDMDNKELAPLKSEILEYAKSLDKRLSIHDFRMVPGETHTNLIFDIVVPYDVKITEKEITERISSYVFKNHNNYYCVITIDKDYT